ncbi:MAG: ImmA/IrrE family metallo-endopeptidase [Syntrophobacteraceae bacterium]
MTQGLAGINPKLLKWARESAGYSLEEISSILKKDCDVIRDWESGKVSPTYVQLEKLAYKIYKRPIAIFFFPEPPDELTPTKSFRTLPEAELQKLHSDTLYAIRQARAMQLALYELSGQNHAGRIIFRDFKINENSKITHIAQQIRKFLGVSLEVQSKWKDVREALSIWRDLIQDAGIFVFKRSMKQRDISGFCLLDHEFPIIYLNNSTPHTRQIFSLFHELVHILLGENGVTKSDDSYINYLSGRYKKVEIFCNVLAAECLVPSKDFSQYSNQDFYDSSLVKTLADRYKVSREVILRRALASGLVDSAYYRKKAHGWAAQAETGRSGSGGNYYATQATYLGSKFIKLAFSQFYQGRFTREQLADFLNVKAQNLDRFEPLAIGRA